MTIVLAGWCPAWGMLAADRLVTSPTLAPEYHSKIVLHPKLPIAVATSGLSTFLHPDALAKCEPEHYGTLPTTLAQAVLEDGLPAYAGSTRAADVAGYVSSWLHPAYLAITRLRNVDPNADNIRLRLVVLTYDNGAVQAAVVHVRREIGEVEQPGNICWGAPDCTSPSIAAYINGRKGVIASPEAMHAILYDAYGIACTAEAIAVDAGVVRARTIGGPLDAVIVDGAGARRIDPQGPPLNG